MKYIYRTIVTIGDTNVFGSAYFLSYLRWSGIVRETWLYENVSDLPEVLKAGNLVTRSVDCLYHQDLYLYDTLRIELTFEVPRPASCVARFALVHEKTNAVHAEAKHKLLFVDNSHRVVRVPPLLLALTRKYSVSDQGS